VYRNFRLDADSAHTVGPDQSPCGRAERRSSEYGNACGRRFARADEQAIPDDFNQRSSDFGQCARRKSCTPVNLYARPNTTAFAGRRQSFKQ
jgi:hypothetical protein